MRPGFGRAFGWLAVVAIVWGGAAAAGQAPSLEEQLRDAAARIDRAAVVLGEPETISRLAALFKISRRTVTDLHDDKLDFGEAALVLALAEAAKTRPETVLSLWATGRLSWSEIALRQKADRRALLKRLEAVRRALAPPRPVPSPKPAR